MGSLSTEMVIIEDTDFSHSQFLLPDLGCVLHYFFLKTEKAKMMVK